MKLNYKRTILVGFAFFLISVFWQAYDATIPVILTNKFGMSQFWSGVIMALDNVLAVFMLPIFGAISDKCRSRYGKRTPFITVGTVIAAVAIIALSFVDNAQLKSLGAAGTIDDPEGLSIVYDSQKDAQLITPEGKSFVLSEKFTEEEFTAITCKIQVVPVDDLMKTLESNELRPDKTGGTILLHKDFSEGAFAEYMANVRNEDTKALLEMLYELQIPIDIYDEVAYIPTATLSGDAVAALTGLLGNTTKTITHPYYTNYAAPARQAYAAAVTAANRASLVSFIVILLLVLIAMATFRSPAVALMPDVTIKPLRSKGNAVINLMGNAGGILVLVLGMVFSTSAVQNALMSYTVYYAVVAGIMLLSLTIFLLTVKEPQWVAQAQADSVKYGIEEEKKEEDTTEKRKLSKAEKKSLLLILASIVLWFFGYNAVTSKYAVYAGNILDKDYNTTMLIAQASAIVAFFPAGAIASKVGRKKTILTGITGLTTAFAIAAFMRETSPDWIMNVIFALAGISFATINVNSLPMVVEMCTGADVGKYTGFYYTASMSAQMITPLVSGWLMDLRGMTILFPYASVFVALSFVTMFMVKHGDSKVEAKKGLEALDVDD